MRFIMKIGVLNGKIIYLHVVSEETCKHLLFRFRELKRSSLILYFPEIKVEPQYLFMRILFKIQHYFYMKNFRYLIGYILIK